MMDGCMDGWMYGWMDDDADGDYDDVEHDHDDHDDEYDDADDDGRWWMLMTMMMPIMRTAGKPQADNHKPKEPGNLWKLKYCKNIRSAITYHSSLIG